MQNISQANIYMVILRKSRKTDLESVTDETILRTSKQTIVQPTFRK